MLIQSKNMDELVLGKIAAASSSETLAALACVSRVLRRLVAEEWRSRGRCEDLWRLLGVSASDPAAAGRATALLNGSFRRCLLVDLLACQRSGRCHDGRRQTLDLLTLPGRGEWLGQVQLLATDMQHVLLYDQQLQPLGALTFVESPAGLIRTQRRARMFFGLLCTLLVKCPLHHGVVCLEPPLHLGAADWLHHQQLQPAEQEALAAAAASAAQRRGAGPGLGLGMDDDFHLLRPTLRRMRVLPRLALLAGSLAGTLDDALVRELITPGRCEHLSLRCLDLGGNRDLSDAGAAHLLTLCPNLRVLHVAGCGQLGPAVLAALAGRAQQTGADGRGDGDAEQRRQQRHRQHAADASQHAEGGSTGSNGSAAGSSRHGRHSASAAAESLQGLRLSSSSSRHSAAAAEAAAGGSGASAAAAAPAPAPAPACPLLECLDLSGCRIKGSALWRALRCLPQLRSLRLNGCAGVGHIFDPLLEGQPGELEGGTQGDGNGSTAGSKSSDKGGSGSRKSDGGSTGKRSNASSRAAMAATALGQLTRLEALDSDLTGRQLDALLRHCTALRALAVSGQQLATEGWDRRRHGKAFAASGSSSSGSGGGGSSGGSTGGSGSGTAPRPAPLPSLRHLEVGWGTGGTFLSHLLSQHSPYLSSLTVRVGAAVSDWHLCQVAASCRHLGRLVLRGANVSDEGVAAVLQGCTQLTSLQLLGCTGPFSDSMACASSSAPGHAAADHSRPQCAFRLQELQIGWGASQLTDAGLAALLRPDRAVLRVLLLQGCSLLTDAAWVAVQQHRDTLECLHIEACGALPTLRKSRGCGGTTALTAGAALGTLGTCRQLCALTLRSCLEAADGLAQPLCQGPFLALLTVQPLTACTSLQSLDID